MADAAGCSNRGCDYVRNSFAVREKRAAARDARVLAALLGDPGRLIRSGRRTAVLAGIASMDAAYVADFYRCNPVSRPVGSDHVRLSIAAIAVLSGTGRGIAQFDFRSRASTR